MLITSVEVWKDTEDEYGNIQREHLGYGIMERDTYERINWDNFDYEDINDVTVVEFDGSSRFSPQEAYSTYRRQE